MHQDQQKHRYYYTRHQPRHNPPLIPPKKALLELKQKQNQKHNIDPHKPLPIAKNQHTLPYPLINTVDKKQQNHPSHKCLSFGQVKNNPKPDKSLHDISTTEPAPTNPAKTKPLQMTKKNNFVEGKQEKPSQDTREKAPPKPSLHSRASTSPIDDFMCTEELEFKPVEKKSLIPQRRANVDKIPGARFEFGRGWEGKKNMGREVESGEKGKGKRNFQRQLKDFQQQQKTINEQIQCQALQKIFRLQEEYSVQPGYLQKQHNKHVTWWSRAILVDWMRHICYEFGLLRQTYHIAVVLLDNYLAKTLNIPKSVLQAIGATTLFIASKLQQYQCKSSREFVKSTNNSCSVQDIQDLQLKITKTLKFKINPPTLYSLANKIISQWDLFLCSGAGQQMNQHIARVHFKQLDQNSFRMFRELMQLIDCAIIDVQTTHYKPKMLVCSFMYLLIGRELGIFKSHQVVNEFPFSSLYLLDEGNQFNSLFHAFLQQVLGFSLLDILPTAQYCATYFSLPFTYQKPMIDQSCSDLETMSLQQYCAYQTYNSSMIKIIKTRYRGLY